MKRKTARELTEYYSEGLNLEIDQVIGLVKRDMEAEFKKILLEMLDNQKLISPEQKRDFKKFVIESAEACTASYKMELILDKNKGG